MVEGELGRVAIDPGGDASEFIGEFAIERRE